MGEAGHHSDFGSHDLVTECVACVTAPCVRNARAVVRGCDDVWDGTNAVGLVPGGSVKRVTGVDCVKHVTGVGGVRRVGGVTAVDRTRYMGVEVCLVDFLEPPFSQH